MFGVNDYLKRRITQAQKPATSGAGVVAGAQPPTSFGAGAVAGATTGAPQIPSTPPVPTPVTDPNSLPKGSESTMNDYPETTPSVSPSTTPASTTAPKVNLGTAYIDRLTQTLSGNDPITQNARANAGTANSVDRYLAGRNSSQQSNNAGYTPGTLQSQRVQDRNMAGANESILQRDKDVNQLGREQYQSALKGAGDYSENLLRSVDDKVTQRYLRGIQASGGDVMAEYNRIYGTGSTGTQGGVTGSGTGTGGTGTGGTGTTGGTDAPHTLSPMEQNKKDIEDTVAILHPEWDRSGPEFSAEVLRRLNVTDGGIQQPMTEAQRVAAAAERLRAASTRGIGALTPEEYTAFAGDLDITYPEALPTTKAQIEAFRSSPTGGFIKTPDGQVYQITDSYSQTRWSRGGGYDDRHKSWAIAKGKDGTVYINDDGDVVNYEPPNAPDEKKVTFKDGQFFAADGKLVYDPTTKKWVST